MSNRENCPLRSSLGICSPMYNYYCKGKCPDDIDDEICTALQNAYSYGEDYVINKLKKDMQELEERLQRLLEREEETNRLVKGLFEKWGLS